MIDLGPFNGSESAAIAVNESGTVLGRAKGADGREQACVWMPRRVDVSGIVAQQP
jgi:hypothetical protein